MRPTLPLVLALSFLSAPAVACAGARAPHATSVEASAPGSEPMAEKTNKKKAKKSEAPVAKAKKAPQTGMTGPTADVQAFREAATAAKDDPKATAELFLKGLAAYVQEYDLGLQMLAMIMPDDDIREEDGVVVPNSFRRDDLVQLDKKPNVMQGYCGGTPDKQYKNADMKNCPIVFDGEYSKSRQGIGYPSEGRAKFFITNGGASRPRPVELERLEDGRWVIDKYGLTSGVASPEEE